MQSPLFQRLEKFAAEHSFTGKGALAVAVQLTRMFREMSFPVNPAHLLTKQGGQVQGLSGSMLRTILKEHGIERVLAAEAGRTSRGSIQAMRNYVVFLNELHDEKPLTANDFTAIEQFWIRQVQNYFASKPFQVSVDASLSLAAFVRAIIDAATKRQSESGGGMMITGAVLQHLVGAKLALAMPNLNVQHESFSTSDQQRGRQGDFELGDTAIHVTTAPSAPVIERCRQNLRSNIRPIIVTIASRVQPIKALAEDAGLLDRIDVFDVEQFISLNVYELSGFSGEKRSATVGALIDAYNNIIDNHETDPSLKIRLG